MWHSDIPIEFRDQIVTGDARELAAAIPDRSIDLIFTDPVYENTQDYAWLAETAARVLKPDRSLLAWTSIKQQYIVKPIMDDYLKWLWTFQYTKIAKTYKMHLYSTFSWWTPCLWYFTGSNPKFSNHKWTIDSVVEQMSAIATAKAPPKGTYKWYKSAEAYERWLLAFTQPGDVIFDPFAGSGSLEVVCKQHGRHYVAFEILPDVATMARKRLDATELVGTQDTLFDEEATALLDEPETVTMFDNEVA